MLADRKAFRAMLAPEGPKTGVEAAAQGRSEQVKVSREETAKFRTQICLSWLQMKPITNVISITET